MPWEIVLTSGLAIWAFFMLPMSVTALTALVAHMEHGSRSWDHLRALPIPRWRIYAAKLICVLGLVAAMSLLMLGLTWGAGVLAGFVKPAVAPTGAIDWTEQLTVLGRMGLAALLLIAIQLWTALRFASFVPALSIGIFGTFFSTVATSAKMGVFFPWQMPVNMLATESWRADTALALGGGVGALALIAMLIHLSRREVL